MFESCSYVLYTTEAPMQRTQGKTTNINFLGKGTYQCLKRENFGVLIKVAWELVNKFVNQVSIGTTDVSFVIAQESVRVMFKVLQLSLYYYVADCDQVQLNVIVIIKCYSVVSVIFYFISQCSSPLLNILFSLKLKNKQKNNNKKTNLFAFWTCD